MSQVRLKENESLENALRRFKKQTARDGVIQEVRKREHYEKPSVKRKKKSEAARKRKYKSAAVRPASKIPLIFYFGRAENTRSLESGR